jgi:hypothetical protein
MQSSMSTGARLGRPHSVGAHQECHHSGLSCDGRHHAPRARGELEQHHTCVLHRCAGLQHIVEPDSMEREAKMDGQWRWKVNRGISKPEALPEKRSIVIPWIHYWYQLVTVADNNISGLTSRGYIKMTDTKDRRNFLYQLLKWADTNIVIFGTSPYK